LRYLVGALLLCLLPAAAEAQRGSVDELLDLSLEELMSVEVSLTGKTVSELQETPAAVHVLTREDIRRSGLTTIPELLRLVPGVHIASIDANKWAISIRGFRSRFASKLLVLIDGRSVYTPLFAGVRWDAQDTLLEDIERIEVIRGPGGSLWGANAVNGIVNIVTRSASQTTGAAVTAAAGHGQLEAQIGARYGARLGAGYGRVYAKFDEFDNGEVLDGILSPNTGLLPVGSGADDAWARRQAGFRYDLETDAHRLTLQGDAYRADMNQTRVLTSPFTGAEAVADDVDGRGANLLARYRRHLGDGLHLQAQTYYDHTERWEGSLNEERDTWDLDVQLDVDLTPGRSLAIGAGYNLTEDDNVAQASIAFEPPSRRDRVVSAFFQASQEFGTAWTVTLGSKFEDNDYSGFEYQPSLRAMWHDGGAFRLWGAISRAVRVPTRFDTDLVFEAAPGVVIPFGNPDGEAEVLHAWELGVRWAGPDGSLSLDGTAFLHDYSDLNIPSGNNDSAELAGTEWLLHWQPAPYLRASVSYSFLDDRSPPSESGTPPAGHPARHQAHAQLYWSPLPRWDLSGHWYYVDDAETRPAGRIDAYDRLDLVLGTRVGDRGRLEVVGQNLLDAVHAEDYEALRLNTGVRRAFYLRYRWGFD
jgi:iron complex outermembrane receptor protein